MKSIELICDLLRGNKTLGLRNRFNRWLYTYMIEVPPDRFIPTNGAIKQLKLAGFSDQQITKIRAVAIDVAQIAIEQVQMKYHIPEKWISQMSQTFQVFDLYLNVEEEAHTEFAEFMQLLFADRLHKIERELQ